MADLYTQIVNAPVGNFLAKNVGLPVPTPLERHTPGDPMLSGRALVGAAPGGRLGAPTVRLLAEARATASTEMAPELRDAAADAGLDAAVWDADAPLGDKFKALVFDASGHPVTEAARVRPGAALRLRFADGEAHVTADGGRRADGQRKLAI